MSKENIKSKCSAYYKQKCVERTTSKIKRNKFKLKTNGKIRIIIKMKNTKSQKSPRKYFVRKVFTLLGCVCFVFDKQEILKITLFQLHIYRKRHSIRISYSKYQFIIQNTPNTPKRVRNCWFSKISKTSKFSKVYLILYKYIHIYIYICI